MTLADARGTLHRRCDDRAKLRIVSLAPPLTELLCDLGLGHQVVGRTAACVHPADEVERMPTVGGTRTVDIEAVRKLAPTHLVVDRGANDRPTVAALEAFVPHVLVAHPRVPRDSLGLYRLLGHVFACEREADRLVARFEAAWSALAHLRATGALATRRVLVVTGRDPWTTIARDSFVAAMLDLIGWRQVDVAAALDTHRSSPERPAIDLARTARGVDRVLLSSGPDGFTELDAELLAGIAPVVQRVDGELLSWYGSRAILGLEYLGRLAAG